MAGTLAIGTISDGTDTGSTTDMIHGSARAWVNFNGTGTVAIRDSYNVSSITDNGLGDFTVHFSTALATINYICLYGGAKLLGTADASIRGFVEINDTARTTSLTRFKYIAVNANGHGKEDPEQGALAFIHS